MVLTKLNKKGASLMEIVAAIAISSICLILIFNMLSFNTRQNAINQEKSINANIANASLSYIKSKHFNEISQFLASNNEGYYAVINVNTCNLLFNNDMDICLSVLSPTINNKVFSDKNLNIFIIPYNDAEKIEHLKMYPPVVFPEILNDYILKINTTNFDINNINPNVIRVIVVIESHVKNASIILEGVITNE